VSTAALEEVWTVRRVLLWTQQRFARGGLASPRLDAELLLAHCLGKSRVGLYVSFEQPLLDAELAAYRELIRRRLAGEPVAYLVGQREFFSLPFHVTPAVLVPRPETELLVEEAIRILDGQPVRKTALEPPLESAPSVALTVESDPVVLATEDENSDGDTAQTVSAEAVVADAAAQPAYPSPKTVVDIGTGSGAIAISIKHERPSVRMLAIDRSRAALDVAEQNAAKLAVAIEFFEGDLLAALPDGQRVDLILANLPYIPTADIAQLDKDVQSEPKLALDGGPDGLVLIRRLCAMAPARLSPGGSILLEVGQGQAPAVEQILADRGFVNVRSLLDLAKIARIVCGKLPTQTEGVSHD
jgi:release factor glutamine methyltransferase